MAIWSAGCMNLVAFAVAKKVKKQTGRYVRYLCHVGQFYGWLEAVLGEDLKHTIGPLGSSEGLGLRVRLRSSCGLMIIGPDFLCIGLGVDISLRWFLYKSWWFGCPSYTDS